MSGNMPTRSKRNKLKPDRRVRRTRERLAVALRELIQQTPLQEITVQDVLQRARVSRSAFYAHFSGTQDLFLTDMDEFLERVATCLSHSGEKSERIVPVREFFAHVGEAEQMRVALIRSERLAEFFDLAREHFARGITQRLVQIPRGGNLPKTEREALAHALAGALMSQLEWWLRKGKRLSADQMDQRFHRLAAAGIAAASVRKDSGSKR